MPEFICRNCGKTFTRFSTLQNVCGFCQYKRMMDINQKSHARKPIQRIGKKAKLSMATRSEWLQQNPSDHFGLWDCYLHISDSCLRRIDIDQLTLDHLYTRSAHPELIFDVNNLMPACLFCNQQRGSKSLDLLAETYPHLKEYA